MVLWCKCSKIVEFMSCFVAKVLSLQSITYVWLRKIHKCMKVFQILILLFLSGMLGCIRNARSETAAPPEIKQVLFVSSYHSEQIWGRKVLNGVRKQLEKTRYNVEGDLFGFQAFDEFGGERIFTGNTITGNTG